MKRPQIDKDASPLGKGQNQEEIDFIITGTDAIPPADFYKKRYISKGGDKSSGGTNLEDIDGYQKGGGGNGGNNNNKNAGNLIELLVIGPAVLIWVPTTSKKAQIVSQKVDGGFLERTHEKEFVCRHYFGSQQAMLSGMYTASSGKCSINLGNRVLKEAKSFEILTNPEDVSIKWVAGFKYGDAPKDAFLGGYNKKTLGYIARVDDGGSKQVGRTSLNKEAILYVYRGKAKFKRSGYEVLVAGKGGRFDRGAKNPDRKDRIPSAIGEDSIRLGVKSKDKPKAFSKNKTKIKLQSSSTKSSTSIPEFQTPDPLKQLLALVDEESSNEVEVSKTDERKTPVSSQLGSRPG